MASLIYAVVMSLDGYVADDDGGFDWAAPDEQVHAFVNDLERPVGTYLYGRRMYEVMSYWEAAGSDPSEPEVMADFAAIWRAAEKVVYSTTLESASTARTRVERHFDVDAVGRLKASASRDLTVGGPTLARHAISAGLVDEYHVFVVPMIVGGGTPAFPPGVAESLQPLDQRRFDNGTAYLHYRATNGSENA